MSLKTQDVIESHEYSHVELNSQLALSIDDPSKHIPLELDKQAARAFFLNDINKRMVFFHDLEEKMNYMIREGYYEEKTVRQYRWEFVKDLYKHIYGYKFRFNSYMGAVKFFNSYALKTYDGKHYLERFEDRVCMTALHLAEGDEIDAWSFAEEMITRRFQPATPTFLNAGTNGRGKMVSCYLMCLSDTMLDIQRAVSSTKALSKDGGGVAICLTNLRAAKDPIKNILGRGSSILPVAKLIEGSAAYANQAGARDGAAVVYVHMCHLDAPLLLDTKKENADEEVRLKTLSIGIVVPDIAYKLAALGQDLYLFSPYDIEKQYGKRMTDISITEMYDELVANPKIRKKKTNAAEYFQTISLIQGQSGYPFIMNEDHVNRANALPGRRIPMLNLCVAPETTVLTRQGEVPIITLAGQSVEIWNGEQWSLSQVAKTGENQPLLHVRLSNGKTLDVTEYHKWYVKDPQNSESMIEKRTVELQPGDELIDWVTPLVDGYPSTNQDVIQSMKIRQVYDLGRISDTYCVSEPLRHMAVFNGILTGNCVEIAQPFEPSTYAKDMSYTHIGRDVSCNLGSLNIAECMFNGGQFSKTVRVAIRALSAVARMSVIDTVPSIDRGNREGRAIGLGDMNFHGFLGHEKIHYDAPESPEFADLFFATQRYHAIAASCELSKQRKVTFVGFEQSKYYTGEVFTPYIERDWSVISDRLKTVFDKYGFVVPTSDQWARLAEDVKTFGMYNQNLIAVAPTGSISYINHSTSSIHPIVDQIESRTEGRLGRVYNTASLMTNQNREYFRNAYDYGWKPLIDVYAAATPHTDQSLSMTVFMSAGSTSRDFDNMRMYAWKKRCKSIYYIRIDEKRSLGSQNISECVACSV